MQVILSASTDIENLNILICSNAYNIYNIYNKSDVFHAAAKFLLRL